MVDRVRRITADLTRRDIFGPPPLLEGEDSAAYDQLLARVSESVSPTNIIEQIWVGDISDLTWEILRLRRLKAGLLSAQVPDMLEGHLRQFLEDDEAEELATRWVRDLRRGNK